MLTQNHKLHATGDAQIEENERKEGSFIVIAGERKREDVSDEGESDTSNGESQCLAM